MVQRLYPKRCSNSLAETVANIEELLTEILVRVPARPLLGFKCVSKHWYSLISHPKFRDRHTRQHPKLSVSAIFPKSSSNFSSISFPLDRDSGSARWNPLSVIANTHGPVKIINSCNGLMLCSSQTPRFAPATSISTCFVLNPTTNEFLKLDVPKEGPSSYIMGCALAFNPSKSPYYKVVCVDTFTKYGRRENYRVLIYSSGTRTWRIPDSVFPLDSRIGYGKRAVYWNGAIHWRGSNCELSYYHIDQERVGFVKSTPECYNKKWSERVFDYFKESSTGSHLQIIDIYITCFTKFEVLEMGKDYSGWFVKYNVDLDPLCTSLPGLSEGMFVVLFLDDEENEEDQLFLHTVGQVISCNLTSKTFRTYELSTDKHFLVEVYNYLHKQTLACI